MNDDNNINFFKSIKCHNFSEPQAWSYLNDNDDDDNDVNHADDINKDNKEEEEDKEFFFQTYQVSYLFGSTSSARFE